MSEVSDMEKSKLKVPFILAACVLVVWGLVGWAVPEFGMEKADRGQFGDQFGSVNSLFAGLAFAGLIYTIWLQRTELALQREELRLTREELRLSREEMQASTQAQNMSAEALTSQLDIARLAARLQAQTAIMTHFHAELVEARKLPYIQPWEAREREKEIGRVTALLDQARTATEITLAML